MSKNHFFLLVLLLFSTRSIAQQPPHGETVFPKGTRPIPIARYIAPYGLEVTYSKTTHIIFPAAIRYVDLGSTDIIAGKAEEAENVLRVKAAEKNFSGETNLSVICDDGSLYTFNVRYVDEPRMLSVEMQDFFSAHGGKLTSNRSDIYFKELGNESPRIVKLIMTSIYQNDRRYIKHIGAKQFGIQFTLNSIYTHNGLLFFELALRNRTQMPYNVEFISFKVIDKKVAKRTAVQETVINPVRGYNQVLTVKGGDTQRTVLAFEQFTMPDEKQLEVTVHEKNGGRTLTFYLENEDIVRASLIDNLNLRL